VIGGALAAGAGVTALRLLAPDRAPRRAERATAAPRTAVQGGARTVDWPSPLTQETARIAHLLRRTTFGAGPHDLGASALAAAAGRAAGEDLAARQR